MSAKVVPATPLPWKWVQRTGSISSTAIQAAMPVVCDDALHVDDRKFIVHAANAYPKLVEALAVFAREVCDDPAIPDNDNFDVDHGITEGDVRKARDLLRELGEMT